MTPREEGLMRELVLEAVAKAVEPLRREIDELKAVDKKHSGQHRLVTNELIPKIANDAERARATDLAVIAGAVSKLVEITHETADRQARTDLNVSAILRQNEAAVVRELDAKGAVSIRPASLVAAETSAQTQETTLDLKRFQKRVTAPLLIIVPIVIEIVRQVLERR